MRKFKRKEKVLFSLALVTCLIGLLMTGVSAKALTNSQGQSIVSEAKKHLGKDYVYGASGPNTFDCSGLVQYVYKQALGISLPRTTYDQANVGVEVSTSELQPGDLVFPSSGHVQIYIGNGQVIHAPHTGDVVRISSLGTVWHARRIGSNSGKNGWYWENGKSYYYENGIKQKGWVFVNDNWYYQDENDGSTLYGLISVNGNLYYLNPTYGHMEKGWQNVNDKWYYFNTIYGHAEKGWIFVNDNWYYQDENEGNTLYGLIRVNGNLYYLNPTYGHMEKGWQKIDNKWYYFNTTYGHAEVNTTIDGYYLDSNGVAVDKK